MISESFISLLHFICFHSLMMTFHSLLLFIHPRRAYWQTVLNKLVVFVMHGVIQPDDASRTAHGCAALLGLQLSTEIPKTALIVTGLRKTAEKKFLKESFSEFGEIMGVAVARGQRGFGMFVQLLAFHLSL